jgi:hypothetical protein
MNNTLTMAACVVGGALLVGVAVPVTIAIAGRREASAGNTR